MALVIIQPNSGADGDALTTSNNNQATAFAYTGVNSPPGTGTMTVETTLHSFDGATRLIHAAKTTTSGTNYGVYPRPAAAATLGLSWYFHVNTMPSAGTATAIDCRSASGGLGFTIGVQSNGKIVVLNAVDSPAWFPNASQTINIAAAGDYRFDLYTLNHDTAGTIKARLYRDSDDAVMAPSSTVTGINMAAADLRDFRIGAGVTSNTVNFEWEGLLHVDMGATDYLPAYGTASPPTGTLAKDGDYQFISAASLTPQSPDTSIAINSITPSTGTVIGVNEDGDPGVFVPNVTQDWSLSIKGTPSGVGDTFLISTVASAGSSVNLTAPRRWSGSAWV